MKKNIAIVMGGYSDEFEISLKSGNVVYKHLSMEKYNLYRIIFTKKEWYFLSEKNEKFPIDKSDFSLTFENSKIKFDAVFNTIHGTPGEDGLLSAYLELLEIPHTKSGAYTAGVTFNKRDCISILKAYRIPTAKNYLINKGDAVNVDEITTELGLPCFVKANRSGSSFGVLKANTEKEIMSSIEEAYKVDHQLILESFLSGTEISVGVAKINNLSTVLGITEIVSENDFFDYEAKYLGKSKEITPARISETQKNEVEQLALKIYNLLEIKGFARTDFIFNEGKPYFLEINTNPGLSEASILPQQSLNKGIPLADLFSNEIEALFS